MVYYFKSFLLLLLSLFVSLAASSGDAVPGTIQRVTKQQILATLPPGATAETPQPFLTSPSGRFAAYFLRGKTAPGAGGFGNDFCYVEVEDTSTGQSEWESECAPVTDANACTLAFTDSGLEVFDGSNSVWSTSADGDHVAELSLVDRGDMRIVDRDGELAWKASDDARANQGCGLAGSAGLAPDSPPFAGRIGAGDGNGPFGQPAAAPAANSQQAAVASPAADGQQQNVGDPPLPAVAVAAAPEANQKPLDEESGRGLGLISAQPLVDNSPFDSGSTRGVLGFASAAALLLHGLLL